MATTTPNYGWTVPTSTDLVKDGATAIETLGDAIDASMNTALGTKKAGMVLLNTTSFSAVASQSVNDVFSATYENYLIQIKSANATNSSLRMRLRVSAADDTSSAYSSAYSVQRTDTSAVSDIQDGVTTSFGIIVSTNNQINFSNINIFRPNLVTATHLSTASVNTQTAGNFSFVGGSVFTNATAFTGFTIFPATSTISGVISVYGYNA